MNIFVRNLSSDVSEDDLKGLFSAYGDVTAVVLTCDSYPQTSAFGRKSQYTDREPRGYAYVEMPHDTEAYAAILGIDGMQMWGLVLAAIQAMPLEKKISKKR
jgi:RNA recognition motif-containing protein